MLLTLSGKMNLQLLPDDVVRDEPTNIISVTTIPEKTQFGVGYDFFHSMRKNKSKVAQYMVDTGETDTYEQLLQRAIRTALHLKALNLTNDDVVCLCSHNQPHNWVPFLACLFLGIPVASLDPSLTVDQAVHLLKLVHPKVFFIVPETVDLILESMEIAGVAEAKVVVYGPEVDTNRFTAFESFLEEHEDELEFQPTMVEDVSETAVILFSSGSTGLPKGICCSHKAVFHQGFLLIHNGIFRPGDTTLCYSTLYWVSAIVTLSACILNGCSRVVHKQYDPKEIWNLLHKYQVAYVFLPPFYAHCMISAGRPDGIDTSALHSLNTGGGHLSKEKIHELRELLPGTFVCQGYGCSELCGVAVMFNLARTKDTLLMHYNPSSTGRPNPGFQYKVVNIETEENCGPDQHGELLVKTEFCMVGYYKQDSSAAYDEGWLCTGDVAYFDENHCFYIVDRKKELLKFRGYQVPPAAVEQVLQEHPSVKQCVVLGIPHELDGDHPMAIVVLHQSYVGKITEEEIESFVEGRVNDSHRLRRGVKFLDVIPTTPSGKIRRKEIRDMVLSGLL